jgi:hypothetical protein
MGTYKIMTQTEANALIGRKVENLRTGHQFTVRDIIHNYAWLSGGQFIPLANFAELYKVIA